MMIGTRVVDTLEALDDILDEAAAARLQSDDAYRALLASVLLSPKKMLGKLPRDPASDEYRDTQLRLYESLRQRTYDVAQEETEFDRAHMLRWPFPYATRSPTTVGNYLMAYGQIIREMSLPKGAHILEMGSGYGPLTYQLASMGYRVTCTDISENLLEYVRTRCAGLPGVVDTVRCDMNAFSIAGVYDAVLFFESFHHVLNHGELLQRIASSLDPNGILVFAGEPIVPNHSQIVPYPWGLRMDGMSLWAIRRQGWLELGFRVDYFGDLLRRSGWASRRVESVSMPGADIWICRRARPAIVHHATPGELVHTWRAPDADIHTQCGARDDADGTLRSQGQPGYLAYGPYARVEPGTYEVVWAGRIEGEAPGAIAEVACGKGLNVLRETAIGADASDGVLARARFHINEPIDDVEFRVRVDAGDAVVLRGMDLYLVR
jgi:2-polyprenyl-3-methyl-5-hydroxy-6-metoxy-1,4-benzoquinol methylase